MPRLSRRRTLVIVLLAAAGSALSCNGDPPPAPPASPDAVSGDASSDVGPRPSGELRVGVFVPLSGPNAAFGPPVANAVQLAAEEINAGGGVLGSPISLVLRDTRSQPQAGLEAAQELAPDPLIRGFVGALSSAVTEGIVTVAAPAGIPTISPASTSPDLTTMEDGGVFFRTVPSDALQGRLLARFAAAAGYTNAAILYVNNTYGKNLRAEFVKHFALPAAGRTVAVQLYHAETEVAPDYARDLTAIADASPPVDVILLITYEAHGVQIMQDQKLFALQADWLFADGLRTEALAKEAGAATVAGARGTAPAPPAGALYNAFAGAYEKRFGGAPGAFTAQAYDAVHLLALAAVRAGSIERSEILAQLGEVSAGPEPPDTEPQPKVVPSQIPDSVPSGPGGVDYLGASGEVDWDENGDPRSANYEVYEFQPDGSIAQLCQVGPEDDLGPCLGE